MNDQDNGNVVGAAVMPEFAEAIGLDDLLGGKESPRPRPAAGQPTSPATETAAPAAVAPSWPPPPPPEPFRHLFVQVDMLVSMIGRCERVEKKFADDVADNVWPLAYYYGAGSERPSPFMLWMMGGLSVVALVTLKVGQIRAAREAAAAADRPSSSPAGTKASE